MRSFRGKTRDVVWLILCGMVLASGCAQHRQPAVAPTIARWQLEHSLKYEALCLLTVLSGDSYYLRY
jgi:hypothetical protein